MIVYTSNNERIILEDNSFSDGGEGSVFKIVSASTRFSNACVKIYYTELREQRKNKIKYMVKNPPSLIQGDGFMIAWPLDFVTDASKKFLGFVMPLAFPGSEQLVVLTTTTISKRLGYDWHDRFERTKNNKQKALLNRIGLIKNISIPLHLMHSTGKYVLIDFKPENVLVNLSGEISIVDIDSIQISEGGRLLYPGKVMTPNYTPPELFGGQIVNNNIPLSKSCDLFSMGVVFYQLLFGLHPYVVTPWVAVGDGNSNEISLNIAKNLFPFGPERDKIRSYPPPHNNFNIIPNELRNLFIRTFTNNPDDRPQAEEWGKLIHNLISQVMNGKSKLELDSNIALDKSKLAIWATDPKIKGKKFAIKRLGSAVLYSVEELSQMNLNETDEIRMSTQSRWHILKDYINKSISSVDNTTEPERIVLSTDSIEFEPELGNRAVDVNIYSRAGIVISAWSIIDDHPSWIRVKKPNRSSLIITVSENTGRVRSCHITIKCGNIYKTITIVQKAVTSYVSSLTLSTDTLQFESDSSSREVKVYVDIRDNWIISYSYPSWIHVKKKNRDTVEISVDENTGSNRNALVEIKCGSLTKSIAVKQDADVKPDVQTSEDRWIYFIISFGGPVMLILLIQMILKSLGIYLNDWEWSDFWGYCVVIMVVDILVIIIAAANSK